jgi:hypothetical protein
VIDVSVPGALLSGFFKRYVVSREESDVYVRRLHLTMNKTKDANPLDVLGSFAPSGFFAKHKVRAGKPVQVVYRKPSEAATPAQAARLSEAFGRGTPSHLRF